MKKAEEDKGRDMDTHLVGMGQEAEAVIQALAPKTIIVRAVDLPRGAASTMNTTSTSTKTQSPGERWAATKAISAVQADTLEG